MRPRLRPNEWRPPKWRERNGSELLLTLGQAGNEGIKFERANCSKKTRYSLVHEISPLARISSHLSPKNWQTVPRLRISLTKERRGKIHHKRGNGRDCRDRIANYSANRPGGARGQYIINRSNGAESSKKRHVDNSEKKSGNFRILRIFNAKLQHLIGVLGKKSMRTKPHIRRAGKLSL